MCYRLTRRFHRPQLSKTNAEAGRMFELRQHRTVASDTYDRWFHQSTLNPMMHCRDLLKEYELATHKPIPSAFFQLYYLKSFTVIRAIQQSIEHNHGAYKPVPI
jgi:hypothetical protein